MPREYLVRWEIDITANSPEDAARQARAMQRAPTSAVVFEVQDTTDDVDGGRITRVDLWDDPEA